MISGTRIAAASSSGTIGRWTTKPAQRPQMPLCAGSSDAWNRFGSAIELIRLPASDMKAGSRVMAASTAVPTATAPV